MLQWEHVMISMSCIMYHVPCSINICCVAFWTRCEEATIQFDFIFLFTTTTTTRKISKGIGHHHHHRWLRNFPKIVRHHRNDRMALQWIISVKSCGSTEWTTNFAFYRKLNNVRLLYSTPLSLSSYHIIRLQMQKLANFVVEFCAHAKLGYWSSLWCRLEHIQRLMSTYYCHFTHSRFIASRKLN